MLASDGFLLAIGKTFRGEFMRFKLKSGILLGVLLLSGCGKASVSCSDADAKSALETAIRENLEKIGMRIVI